MDVIGLNFLILFVIAFFSGLIVNNPDSSIDQYLTNNVPDAYADLQTSSLSVNNGTLIKLTLPYDPIYGPRWRITVSEGLFIEKQRYLKYPEDMVVSTEGMIEYYIRVIKPGEQRLIARYLDRSGISVIQILYDLSVIVENT